MIRTWPSLPWAPARGRRRSGPQGAASPAPAAVAEHPRRLPTAYAAVVAGGLCSVAALNWLVNPWRIYAPTLLPPMTMDLRLEKCMGLRAARSQPQQLVLGSSRMHLLEPAWLERRTGLRTFNAAVSGATPVDDLAMYRFATEVTHAPVRSVVLGVEASTLRDPAMQYWAIACESDLRRFLPGVRWRWVDLRATRLLLSGSQAWASLRTLHHEFSGGARRSATCYPDGMLRDPDEHGRRFPRDWSLTRRIRASMERYPFPGGIHSQSLQDMGTLLRLMREQGVQVVMVATPMHAAGRAVWRRDGYADDEQQALATLARLARQSGARFVDFSSPEAFGGDPDGFFDGCHPTLATSRRMIDALFPPRGR